MCTATLLVIKPSVWRPFRCLCRRVLRKGPIEVVETFHASSVNYGPRRKTGPRKICLQTHSSCSPPRKSLVKGERFVRVEGKPELLCKGDNGCFIEQNAPKRVGPLIYRLQIRMRLFNMCSLRRNSE